MISSKDIQNKYVKMYTQLRNYIWDYTTVEQLAELEVEVYAAFPDISNIQRLFNILLSNIQDVMKEDEELAESVESFKECIEAKDTTFYCKLNQVKEVIQK